MQYLQQNNQNRIQHRHQKNPLRRHISLNPCIQIKHQPIQQQTNTDQLRLHLLIITYHREKLSQAYMPRHHHKKYIVQEKSNNRGKDPQYNAQRKIIFSKHK